LCFSVFKFLFGSFFAFYLFIELILIMHYSLDFVHICLLQLTEYL
jgi:hypothetical protein